MMKNHLILIGLIFLFSCSESSEKNEKSVETSNTETVTGKDSLISEEDTVLKTEVIIVPYMENEKYGYMNDSTLERVSDPVYKIAGRFSEGFASVLVTDGFWYLIDENFKSDFKFPHFIPVDYPNELAGTTEVMISTEGFLPIKYREGKFGFMKMKNRSTFGNFDEVMNFSNGLAAVRVSDKWGFIDQTGKFILPLKFDHVFSFSDNRAYVCEFEHCYFIDKKGNRYFDHKYLRQAYRFKEGLTFVTYSENYDQYFLVDTTGKVVNKGPYDAIFNLGFENGECEVMKNGKCIVIDKKGNKIRDKKDGCQEGC